MIQLFQLGDCEFETFAIAKSFYRRTTFDTRLLAIAIHRIHSSHSSLVLRARTSPPPLRSFVFLLSTAVCRLFVRQIHRTTCPVYLIRRTTTRTRSHLSRSAYRTTRVSSRATRPRTAEDAGLFVR